jgi:hypothetical protein
MRRFTYEEIRVPMFKAVICGLVAVVCLMGVYAQRQRAWADNLHGRLVQANLDDMELWKVLRWDEKQTISQRFLDRGEVRIADWISKQ